MFGDVRDDGKYAGETLRSILKIEKAKKTETPQARRSSEGGFYGGSERDRTVDLAIFSRSLYQLSYRAMNSRKDPDKPGQTIPSDSGRT